MTNDDQDVRIVALTCPNCGADLQVSADTDRAHCDHCGSTVLIIDREKGTTKLDAPGSDAAVDEKANARAVRFVIIGIVIVVIFTVVSTIISSAITVITSVLGGFLKVILGIVLLGLAR